MSILCDKENYIQRMNDAFKYKKQLLKYIQGTKILDFGCGSGILASAIKEKNPNYFVVGYDQSKEMIAEAQTYGRADLFTTDSKVLNDKYDTIILCSVLHEVFSYGNGGTSIYVLMQQLYSCLNPNGVILIRDGFANTYGKPIHCTFKDQSDALEFYNVYATFYNWKIPTLEMTKNGLVLYGYETEMKEFLNKYTWGWNSLPREINEKINFFTLQEYKDLAFNFAFRVDVYKIIKQKGFFKHLAKKVNINHEWNTNVIIRMRS